MYKASIKYYVLSIKGVRIYLFPIILATYYLILSTATAHAEGFSLAVSPPTIVIQSASPAIIDKQITLQNKTDQSITLDIKFEPFEQAESKNGKVSYALDKDFFASDPDIFQKITILDNGQEIKTLTLAPRQGKTLGLHIALPESQTNADYYFSILFISKDISTSLSNGGEEEKIRAYANLEAAIGLHVLLSVFTGEKSPEGLIDAYTAPLFVQSGPVPFTLTFRNTGSFLLRPEGIVVIKNMFGQGVGRVTIPQTNVLAKTSRVIPIAWSETFLLGPYTADLVLTIPDTTTTFHRTISFVALPIQAGLGIIALVILFFLLRRRIRRYLI